jgi:hypothetical protein
MDGGAPVRWVPETGEFCDTRAPQAILDLTTKTDNQFRSQEVKLTLEVGPARGESCIRNFRAGLCARGTFENIREPAALPKSRQFRICAIEEPYQTSRQRHRLPMKDPILPALRRLIITQTVLVYFLGLHR